MVPDVVEVDQAITGQRREGSYYAFASFFQKLATGLALWAMGQTLALAGYLTPSASNPTPVQSDLAIAAIRIFTGPIPAVLLALAIAFAYRYPITREKHTALVQSLAAMDRNG